MGIIEWLKASDIVYSATSIHSLNGWFSILLLFVGFDLLTLFATGIGGALGPILGGFIFGKTGSYSSGWVINTILLLIISLLILALKPGRSRLSRYQPEI